MTGVDPPSSAAKRARYSAHDAAGEPGSGSMRLDEDGDRGIGGGMIGLGGERCQSATAWTADGQRASTRSQLPVRDRDN